MDAQDDLGITPVVVGAISLHEAFVALRAGGFTEDQALRICALRLTYQEG